MLSSCKVVLHTADEGFIVINKEIDTFMIFAGLHELHGIMAKDAVIKRNLRGIQELGKMEKGIL
jgi:hypothetical protein